MASRANRVGHGQFTPMGGEVAYTVDTPDSEGGVGGVQSSVSEEPKGSQDVVPTAEMIARDWGRCQASPTSPSSRAGVGVSGIGGLHRLVGRREHIGFAGVLFVPMPDAVAV